jgi:hypothetical protein
MHQVRQAVVKPRQRNCQEYISKGHSLNFTILLRRTKNLDDNEGHFSCLSGSLPIPCVLERQERSGLRC